MWSCFFLFFFYFFFFFFCIYKKGLVLESVLRNMINVSAGLSQDVAQWLVLIKRLQVNSGFWLHCGENKWGVCDAKLCYNERAACQKAAGHVLHLSRAHVHAVYHTHKYSEITLRVIHVYTRLHTWKITETERPFLLSSNNRPVRWRHRSGRLSAIIGLKGFFLFFERLGQDASELCWLERLFLMNGNAALCHYVYLSHH